MSTTQTRSYQCENCESTVRWREVEREVFKYKKLILTLQEITIGVCDGCGLRYYSADTLHAFHAVAIHEQIVNSPVKPD